MSTIHKLDLLRKNVTIERSKLYRYMNQPSVSVEELRKQVKIVEDLQKQIRMLKPIQIDDSIADYQ
ncbi:hypothetical protein LSG31_08175 [Fodinisporobacter ferrooxydans]|uniref:Uncharacterized protein n=1 Tax=Fodinisporobacter ferrooxydans TaxID=2901836 RepID=A0ABY4CRC9_9BACL|nr:hypothetical protein LSG31_08175 [Alicyclobacillaceae bacterium MYW30-H2]